MFNKENAFLLLLGFLLVTPFVLREMDKSLESYPAILLPAGACLIRADAETFDLVATEAYVLDTSGKETKVMPRAILGKIPLQYFTQLVKRRFGLEPPAYQRYWATRLGRGRDFRWSDADRLATRTWLLQNLAEVGHFQPLALRIVRVSYVLDVHDGSVLDSSILESYDIALQ